VSRAYCNYNGNLRGLVGARKTFAVNTLWSNRRVRAVRNAECTATGEPGVSRETAVSLVFDGSTELGEITVTGKRTRELTGKTVGLTTGQAARYCLVSPDTMANWIKARQLPAQRTIGGQFRILIHDLRQFMVRHKMSTALLDGELDCRPYCWEGRSGMGRSGGARAASCRECPVYRTKALDCFALRALSPARDWARAACRDCAYFQRWADQRSDE
jgi:excisionase family DNA binding protein